MSAPELIRLSFYGFTAASLAVLSATILYLMEVAWLARVPRPPVTPDTLVATWQFGGLRSTAAGRLASVITHVGAAFAGLAVLLRAIVARRGPYSDMYEVSVAFVFVSLLGYLWLEKAYRTRSIGAVALPVILGMIVYVWSLPADLSEVRG